MPIGNALKRIGADVAAEIRTYDGSRLRTAAVIPSESLFDGRSVSDAGGRSWRADLAAQRVADDPESLLSALTVTLDTDCTESASAALVLTFGSWSVENYVLMPAAVYAGNRFESRAVPYPPVLSKPEDLGPDVPTIVTDVPRLNNLDGVSRIQLLAGDMSTPAVGIFFPSLRQGLWLLTPQSGSHGDYGFDLEESSDRSSAVLRIVQPGVREGERYFACGSRKPSEDRGARLSAGETLSLDIRLCVFACESVQELYDRFMPLRKSFAARTQQADLLPFSAAWAIQEEKVNRENWDEAGGYYRVGSGDSAYADWQAGWVGGAMSTLPLLADGDALSRNRAERNFDFLFQRGQGASGLFHGILHNGEAMGDGFGNPGTERWHLVRKSADVLYFLLKQYAIIESRQPDLWEHGTRRCADYFVGVWERHGQFGQFNDVETGEIIVGGSASAAIAPAGLALAYERYHDDRYLRTAVESAAYFDRAFRETGCTTGGPGEILQCPDSESAFGLLESYVTLLETTGDRVWQERALAMVRQAASWCMSYDFRFPVASTFGRLGMQSTGTVFANAQNKHSAPGICTLSGDSLLRLFRATGDAAVLDLLRDIAHSLPQFLSRTDRPISEQLPGWMNERVNTSDWLEPVGEVFKGSCWCETTLMLTHSELPGIYFQPDTGVLAVLDHVEASVTPDADGAVRLSIHNPTPFDATVKLLIEASAQARRALSRSAVERYAVVAVPAGQTVLRRT